jgi:hypothetical protein
MLEEVLVVEGKAEPLGRSDHGRYLAHGDDAATAPALHRGLMGVAKHIGQPALASEQINYFLSDACHAANIRRSLRLSIRVRH